jgi:hypothetical protein
MIAVGLERRTRSLGHQKLRRPARLTTHTEQNTRSSIIIVSSF